MGDIIKITSALLDFGDSIKPEDSFPTIIPEAKGFALKNPFAFALAICLDRQTKADIIWTIPYDLHEILGHLDPLKIIELPEQELVNIFSFLPRKPRFINDAPRTVKELSEIVVHYFDSDASNIWVGKSAFEVKNTFQRIYGVGPGIANMAVLLIEKAYKIEFSDLDKENMDIKADVHTIRVLYRLGISKELSEKATNEAARKMNPKYPGQLDTPLWIIGRSWCFARKPDCFHCPVEPVCQKQSISIVKEL